MSKVDDSDNQRIQEMNEAQYRRRVDTKKRDLAARTQRSFNEVMSEKGRRKIAKDLTEKQNTEQQRKDGRKVLNKVHKQAQDRSPAELARRAAMNRSMQGLNKKKGTKASQLSAEAADSRVGEILENAGEEVAFIDREAREEERGEDVVREERQVEFKQENQPNAPIDARAEDQRQKQSKGEGQGDDARRSVEGIAASEDVQTHSRVTIPKEVIAQLVKTIYSSINKDGRTQMQVTLNGPGLEGVKLRVSSEKGRVSCSFEGCGQELKSFLRKGKPALTRGLAKRGLKLVSLRVG